MTSYDISLTLFCVGEINHFPFIFRGSLYLAAYTLKDRSEDCKEFFPRTFSVTYNTALRYLHLGCLIRKYPKLLIAGITMNQLIKHRKDLTNFLANDKTGLSDELSSCVEVVTQNRRVTVEYAVVVIPELRGLSYDPDAKYLESIESWQPCLAESAKPFEKYVDNLIENDQILEIVDPPSSVDIMEKDLLQLTCSSPQS